MMQHKIVSDAARTMVTPSTSSPLVFIASIIFTKIKGVSKPRSNSFPDYL
jgi:hypothetical protein